MSAPTVTRDDSGVLTINWPDPKPASFEIESETFEMFIDLVNDTVKCENDREQAQRESGSCWECGGSGVKP